MVEQMQEHKIGSSTEKIREGAQEFSQAVSDTARNKMGEYRNKINEYSDQASDLIQQNPYTSVLVAFGIGAAIGLMFFRRD